MKLWTYLFGAVVLIGVLFGGFYFLRKHPGGECSGVLSKVVWQRMVIPGAAYWQPRSE